MRRYFVAVLIAVGLVFSLWIRGMVPFSGDFMRAWFEPWKTDTAVNGVPTIAHKAIGDDVFRQIYPAKVLSVDLLRRGMLPLWNPYNGAGQPLFAIQHYGFVNPATLVFFITSPIHAWTILFVGQFLVIFLSTFIYAVSIGMTTIAAIFVATSLILSGYVVTNAMFGTYLYAYAGLPLLLWSVDRVMARKERSGGWLPVAVALIVLTGFPQVSLYILLFGVVYAVYRMKTHKILTSPGIWMWFVFAGMVGAGLTAFQLVPTYELYERAAITTETSAFIFRTFLLPLQHFITVLIPNFFGNPSTYNYWGKPEYVESVSSVGSIVIFFVVVSLLFSIRKKRSLTVFFVGTAVGSLLLCLRWWGSEWLYRLPIPVLTTGAPSRVMGMATFSLAVLGGYGIDAFITVKNARGITRVLIGLLCILGMMVLSLFVLMRLNAPCGNPVITGCFSIALRNTVLETFAFCIVLVVALISFHRWISRRTAVWGAIIVVLLFGGYNAYKFIPFTSEINVMPEHPLLTVLKSFAPNRIGYLGNAVIPTDFGTYYRFFDNNYYDPLYVRRYGELVSYVNTGDRSRGILRSDVVIIRDASVSAALSYRRDRLWDITGTSEVLTRKTDHLAFSGEISWEDPNWRVVARDTALPRAYLVSDVSVQSNPDTELRGLFSPQADVRHSAFVEVSVPDWRNDSNATGTAIIRSYEPNRITITVTANAKMFLVLSDTDYPGWKAGVDGRETPVYRTNFAFRGVVVPKGSHTIIFYFDPTSMKVGSVASIASGILLAYMVWLAKRKSSKN